MLFYRVKKALALVLVCVSLVMLAGCGKGRVVLTTGFGSNEVFRVGNERGTTAELMIYLVNLANQYEQVYGESLWAMEIDEGESTTMFEKLKELALAQLSQVKAMKLLAEVHGVELTEDELAAVHAASDKYQATLTEAEKDALGISKGETVRELYREKLLADKLYTYLIRDVNPEISDDEARIITVQHILLKTYTMDEYGNREELDADAVEKVRQTAEEIRALAIEGESFDSLISKYSEDSKGTYSFGVGDMEEAFEAAAYALATDEIGPVVRTSHGYHVIKCISTLDREQTDLNKEKLLVSRKQEVFGDTYNAFVGQLDKQANTELILSLELPDNSVVDTAEFFSIYESELGSLYATAN